MVRTIPRVAEEPHTAAEVEGAVSFVSVIVPVTERFDDLSKLFEAYAAELEVMGVDFEFLIVFDGGYQHASEALVEYARRDDRLHLFCFEQTFGETAALRAGIEHSAGDIIVTVPAYFQTETDGIVRILEALDDGAELVVTRRHPRRDGFLNRVQNRVFHSLVRLIAGVQFRDMACGLRAMRRQVAETIPLYGDMHRFLPALAVREGYEVREIDVEQHELDRRARIYRPGIYVRRVLDIIAFVFLTKFTEKPLRFFGFVGALCIGLGGLISAILLVQKLGGQSIANRPMLLLAVLLLAIGAQIVGLGLVGEIIVHLRSPGRRGYRIRETL